MPIKKKEVKCIENDFESFLSKVKEKHSNLEVVGYKSHVVLPSGYLGRVKEGVASVLTNVLLKFSNALNGLPLAFNNKNVKLVSRMAAIVADQPYIHFDVETDLVLFKPKQGDILQGVIRLCHIQNKYLRFGCVVHDYIYAYGSCDKDKFELNIGDSVLVEVVDVHHDGYELLVIEVRLVKVLSPLVSTSNEENEIDSGIDENKSAAFNLSPLVDSLVTIDEKKEKKKAKKKKKHEQEEEVVGTLPFQSDPNPKESKSESLALSIDDEVRNVSSLRHWLSNKKAPLEADDDDVADLLTFKKKSKLQAPTKRSCQDPDEFVSSKRRKLEASPACLGDGVIDNQNMTPSGLVDVSESASFTESNSNLNEADISHQANTASSINPVEPSSDNPAQDSNQTFDYTAFPLHLQVQDKEAKKLKKLKKKAKKQKQEAAVVENAIVKVDKQSVEEKEEKRKRKEEKRRLKEEKKQRKEEKRKIKEGKKKEKEEKRKIKEEKKKRKEEKRRIKEEKKKQKEEKRTIEEEKKKLENEKLKQKEEKRKRKEEKRKRKEEKRKLKNDKKLKKQEKEIKTENFEQDFVIKTETVAEKIPFPLFVTSIKNESQKPLKSRKRKLNRDDAQFLPDVPEKRKR